MNGATRRTVLAGLAATCLVAGLGGCGTAQAERLEVTYYYLPG